MSRRNFSQASLANAFVKVYSRGGGFVEEIAKTFAAELLPARIKPSSRSRSSALKFTTYFLTAISFPATNLLHRCPRSDRDSEKHHRFKDAGD
jgi:hypothetical protein